MTTSPYCCNTRRTSLLSARFRGLGWILTCTAWALMLLNELAIDCLVDANLAAAMSVFLVFSFQAPRINFNSLTSANFMLQVELQNRAWQSSKHLCVLVSINLQHYSLNMIIVQRDLCVNVLLADCASTNAVKLPQSVHWMRNKGISCLYPHTKS